MKSFLLIAAAMFSFASSAKGSQISDLFESQRQVYKATPELTEVTLCITDRAGVKACETFDTRQLRSLQDDFDIERKGGKPELLYERPKGDSTDAMTSAVGALIGSMRDTVGVGGRFSVDLETRKDGTFKLHVEGAFGTGSAAGPATGSGGGGGSSGPIHQN